MEQGRNGVQPSFFEDPVPPPQATHRQRNLDFPDEIASLRPQSPCRVNPFCWVDDEPLLFFFGEGG
jgi:hypothetical protein